jgi:hypothetical protein
MEKILHIHSLAGLLNLPLANQIVAEHKFLELGGVLKPLPLGN